MRNIEHELNQDTEPQASGSEVVAVGAASEVKAQPRRKPRQFNHLTVKLIKACLNHHPRAWPTTWPKPICHRPGRGACKVLDQL